MIPVLTISNPDKRMRQVFARVSIDLCRQAGYRDHRLFKCFVVLNKVAEEVDHGLDDKAFVDIYMSEQAIDDKIPDESTIFRTAVRECLESEEGFEPSRDSALKTKSCLDSKDFEYDLDIKVMKEEDTRRRALNRFKFNPQTAGLLEKLKNDPLISE